MYSPPGLMSSPMLMTTLAAACKSDTLWVLGLKSAPSSSRMLLPIFSFSLDRQMNKNKRIAFIIAWQCTGGHPQWHSPEVCTGCAGWPSWCLLRGPGLGAWQCHSDHWWPQSPPQSTHTWSHSQGAHAKTVQCHRQEMYKRDPQLSQAH